MWFSFSFPFLVFVGFVVVVVVVAVVVVVVIVVCCLLFVVCCYVANGVIRVVVVDFYVCFVAVWVFG